MLNYNGGKYYVYFVRVNDRIVYVGKGSGDRYKHAVSGSSSVPELNRHFFSGDKIEVFQVYSGLSEEDALYYESEFVYVLKYHTSNLYNKKFKKYDDFIIFDFEDDFLEKRTLLTKAEDGVIVDLQAEYDQKLMEELFCRDEWD